MLLIANANGDWWEAKGVGHDLFVLDTDSLTEQDKQDILKSHDIQSLDELLEQDKVEKVIWYYGDRIEVNL